MNLVSHQSGPLQGDLILPGDKSISHRALILGALAVGRTEITGLLEAADVHATAAALGHLGVSIERAAGVVVVDGVGTSGLRAPDDILDLGNSGTGARLLMGALAGHAFPAVITGDRSLRARPMGRVIRPLAQMGARFEAREGDRLPASVVGTHHLQPIRHESAVASAQVKSAVLLAGLHAPGRTSLCEPAASRDHTENMLRAMGAEVLTEALADGRRQVSIEGHVELAPLTVRVPADPSAAAFPIVAALLLPGSHVRLEGVGLNVTRTGLLTTLQEMGATIEIENARQIGGEPVGDLVIRSAALNGVDVPAERAPAMIDEYPVLAVAAACAGGRTVMRGLAELRLKESDRLAAIAAGLGAAGVKVEVGDDWLAVTGAGNRRPAGGHVVDAQHDHRIAMSFAVLGLAAEAPVTVTGAETIATSFPDFVPLMRCIGCRFEVT